MKTISLIILCLFLISCKKTTDNELDKGSINHTFKAYSKPFKNKGMDYRVYSNKLGGIHVVNETLDSLEIELIKKQISVIE